MVSGYGNRALIRRILVPTDGSEGALEAAAYAARLAGSVGVSVTLLHVVDVPRIAWEDAPELHGRLRQELTEAAKAILTLTKGRFAQAGVAVETDLREGSPAQVICEVAGQGHHDLIVIGARGSGASQSWLLGSVVERVMRCSPCPVLIVRWPAADAA